MPKWCVCVSGFWMKTHDWFFLAYTAIMPIKVKSL
jgi:hypothetical protein